MAANNLYAVMSFVRCSQK